jgi:hypothetical protein
LLGGKSGRKRSPLLLVYRKTPSSESRKALHGSRENMPKRVRARTNPCFIPFLILKESKLNGAVHVLVDDVIMLRGKEGGYPIR